MDREQERVLQTEAMARLVQPNTQSDNPIDDLAYRDGLTKPKAQSEFDDINQDMQLANLDESELIAVRLTDELINDLRFIKSKNGLGSDMLVQAFRRTRDVINITSLAKEGALREWIHESKGSQKITFGKGHKGQAIKQPGRIKIPFLDK